MATHRMFGRSQIDASDAFHDFSCSPCSEDGKNTEALYHCSICQAFYCERCVNVHNKFTKNHSVTDKTSDTFGQNFGKSATQSSNDLPTDVCEEHHGEVVKMFCGHHDLVCCTVCIAVKHRSCEGVEYIPNIASRMLTGQGKEKTKTSLEKVKADLKDLKTEMENNLKHLDKQRDGIIDDMQEFKKRIIARVEEMERKSLKEVKSKHKELADNIKAHSKKIDDLLNIIDTRLQKLAQSKRDNDAQNFVDVKRGEKEMSWGTDLVKQTSSRSAKFMSFKIDKDPEMYLSQKQSLGTLKEYTCVSIVCPFETEMTNAFVCELQTQLKRHGIESEYIKHTEIVADRYTIVLFENSPGVEDEAMKKIKGVDDSMIILMSLKLFFRMAYGQIHIRKVKAAFEIEYTEEISSFFDTEEYQRIYESVSSIVKNTSDVVC